MLIMAVMVFVNVLVYVCMHPILWFLRVPQEVMEEMQQSVMNFGLSIAEEIIHLHGGKITAIERPSPAPPVLESRASSKRLNFSNILLICSCGIVFPRFSKVI